MILFFAVGVSALSIIGIYSYFNAKEALLKRTLDQLTSIRVIKKREIEFFFNERFNNIKLLSENDYIKKLISDINIEINNRHSNKPFRKTLSKKIDYKLFGFSNIYILLDSKNVFPYSLKVQADEVTLSEPDSITKNQFKELFVKSTSENEPVILDFTKQNNKSPEPQCFIGKSIFNQNGKVVGVLALQLPIKDINNIMLEDSPENGLGVSGEAYLVGDDYLMRSNSRFIPNSVLNTVVKTTSAINAFKNKEGSSLIDDYRTISCLSSYDRLDIKGLNWAIIAEIDYREAMIPIVSLRNDIVFLSLIICVFLFSIAHFISRNITNPIIKLKNATLKIGEGDLDVNLKPKSSDEIGLLTTAFNKMALQLKDERLKRMSALYDGQELERQRISRELHDGLGQKLIAIKLLLESTSKQSIDETRVTLEDVKINFHKTIEEVRQISNNLAPNILNESGIDVALKNLCDSVHKSAKIDIEFSTHGDYSISDPKAKFYIYRIAQEALNNAVKHSSATKIQIQLIGNLENIILVIEDDGKGFIYDSIFCQPCNGIYNMKERTRLLNGTIDIETELLMGTTIRLKIPKTHIVS